MNDRLLMSPPDVGEVEEGFVVAALRSGWVAPTGPDLSAFEREMAQRCGVEHAVAVSSGTAALHLSLLHIGAGPGDVVMVPSMTFVASANAVVYTGATPCFIDSNPDGNLNADLLDSAIRAQRDQGVRVAAVMVVALRGRCADYDRLVAVCREHGVPMVEDAAEALGATYNGAPAGSFGDAAVLSFNGNKIMTTSGGGMLLTDDSALAEHCRFLSTQAREPVTHYEHLEIGFNYRMSNILAALGRGQLLRLDEMIGRRRLNRRIYRSGVAELRGCSVFQGADDEEDNCWLTALVLDESAPVSSREVLAGLETRGIEARPLWKPMHLQPVFADAPAYVDGTAERLFESGVTLPSGSVHSENDIKRVVSALGEIWDR